jgi:hypothetical protein
VCERERERENMILIVGLSEGMKGRAGEEKRVNNIKINCICV